MPKQSDSPGLGPVPADPANAKQERKTISMAELRANPVYSMLIEDFPFSVRFQHVYQIMELRYIAELIRCTEEECLRFHNLGRGMLNETKAVLKKLGLEFGMIIVDAPAESSPPGNYDKRALRPILDELWEVHEQARTPLERLAAPNQYFNRAGEWLQAARELLAREPAMMDKLIKSIPDNIERLIISERLKPTPTAYKELDRMLRKPNGASKRTEAKAVRSFKQLIRTGPLLNASS